MVFRYDFLKFIQQNQFFMIKFSEIKPGDIVVAEFEGTKIQGTVKDVNRGGREVCVETDVQQFWFSPEHLYAIPLDEKELLHLGFVKERLPEGGAKYKKDSFRLLLSKEGDFSHFDIWWREDKRHIQQPIFVHELQNHYYDMTKVELNP
jgi:hypothetical protein